MVTALSHLPKSERDRIAAAVAAAQAQSDARFALVVVPASDRYHLYPVVWGACLSLVVLAALAIALPHLALPVAAATVVVVFLAASLLLEWKPLHMMAIPKRAKRAHAHALAHREFAARILSHGHGGVLFFVSLAERQAVVLADHGLHEVAGQAAWDRIVADFTALAAKGRIGDAFAAGASACGALLATHKPKA